MNTNYSNTVKRGFLSLIFENIMFTKPQTLNEFIAVIASSIHDPNYNEDGFEDFIAEPKWGDIKTSLRENSFRYNLSINDFPKLDTEFDSLIRCCSEFYKAVDENVPGNNQYDNLCLNYLQSYSNMMIAMNQFDMLNDDLCYTSGLLQSIITGFDWSKNQLTKGNNKVRFLGLYSPETWEKFCVFFGFLKNHPLYNNSANAGSMVLMVFHDLIKEKFLHMFFEDVIISGKRYIETYYNVGFPSLVERNSLSSVEPIRPVRLVEKIRAYIENCEASDIPLLIEDGKSVINIAIIGYVNIDSLNNVTLTGESEELQMLCSTLELLYSSQQYIFNFTIYVNKNDSYFSNIETNKKKLKINTNSPIVKMTLEKSDYLSLFLPRNQSQNILTICDVIDQNNIVLILDTPNLYSHAYYLLHNSSNDFLGQGAYDNYVEDYNRLDFRDSEILVSGYKYAPIHILTSKINMQMLNVDSNDDTLKYKLNTPLIDYLKYHVENAKFNDYPRDVHIFISSKTSVQYSQYARENFTRVERYNGKNFNLITLRSSNQKKYIEAYTSEKKKNYIVFSFWNFIKNIDYHMLDNGKLFKHLNNDSFRRICMDSANIYIKMKWENSLERFDFTINYEKNCQLMLNEKNKDLLRNFMNDIFEIIFSTDNDLFSECLRHAFSNTIYSQMEYLDDAVFYCVFYGRFPGKTIPQFSVNFGSLDERPVISVNQPVFWTVVRTIDSLGSDPLYSDELSRIKREFRKNLESYKFKDSADSFEALLQSIKSICILYGYTDSNLYHNILKILQ